MGWDKMEIAKSRGDLSFRNLQGFNIALLEKYIWNFCCNPSSLVARLYKVRYFLEGHILQASKGNDSSFIWLGLWEAIEKFRANFRWILEDGKDIRIFKDPWFKGKDDYCIENSHLTIVKNDYACSYFCSNSKVWDEYKVQQHFHQDDSNLFFKQGFHKVKQKIESLGVVQEWGDTQ